MTSQTREHNWQVFKTVVYVVGYSLCCLWLFNYNLTYASYLAWCKSVDLALYARIVAGGVWGVWTIGVVGIIMDGMRKTGGVEWKQ